MTGTGGFGEPAVASQEAVFRVDDFSSVDYLDDPLEQEVRALSVDDLDDLLDQGARALRDNDWSMRVRAAAALGQRAFSFRAASVPGQNSRRSCCATADCRITRS